LENYFLNISHITNATFKTTRGTGNGRKMTF